MGDLPVLVVQSPFPKVWKGGDLVQLLIRPAAAEGTGGHPSGHAAA